MALKGNEPKVRCSFCGKPEDKVHKLIAGPDGAYICDECIELCAEILSAKCCQRQTDGFRRKDDNQLCFAGDGHGGNGVGTQLVDAGLQHNGADGRDGELQCHG